MAQVKLKLPLKPRLPLRGNERIALAPFVIATEAEKARDKRLQNVDLQAEFQRFLKKQIEKKTKLEIVSVPPELKLPTQNLSELGRSTESIYQKASIEGVSLRPTNQSPYNRRKK